VGTGGTIVAGKKQVRDAVYFLNRALELDPDGFVSQGHFQKALMMDTP